MDEKTKAILKTWPLTKVRRWAAAPSVFTLDFGDYQDQYYSVQTTEGIIFRLFTLYKIVPFIGPRMFDEEVKLKIVP